MITKEKSIRAALLGTALSLVLGSFAGADAMKINLDTAVDNAFKGNPSIRIAEYKLDAAKAGRNAARQSYGPTVKLTHNTGRSGYRHDQPVLNPLDGSAVKNPVTGEIMSSKRLGTLHSNAVEVTLPVYTGGLLEGTVKKAEAAYDSSVLGEEIAYMQLKKNTADAYYNLLKAQDARRVCRESVDTLKDHVKNVKAAYDVGVVAKVDLLRSEVELANAEQNLIKAENSYALAEANLNKIMGISQGTELEPEESLSYIPYEKTLEECLAYAMENRLELQQSLLRVRAAEASVNMAKSGYRPQVGAMASESWSDQDWPGDRHAKWTAGFNVKMNVFDMGVTDSKVDSAKAELMVAREMYCDDRDMVKLDVRKCYYDLRDAEKRLAATELAVSRAEEDYHIASVRYSAGVGTNTDVLDAQVALTLAKNNYNGALYDYNASGNALETAMGVKVPAEKKVEKAKKRQRIKATNARFAALK